VNNSDSIPRLVVAGMSGDSGKTMLALGLLLMLRDQHDLRAFKKGPDYIDTAWLTWASGRPARNLDTYLMGFPGSLAAFARSATRDGINIVEGNRGMYDGADSTGTHSTAELAKLIRAPILLLVNASKVTRTAAAGVLGCQTLDRETHIGGVILNQVASARHERVLRDAIESICRLPVMGVLPRAAGDVLLPARHLGLLTPCEHPRLEEMSTNLLALVQGRLDIEGILALARAAPALAATPPAPSPPGNACGINIGVLKDSAFSFYYPDNLEALEQGGASLVPISPLTARTLPAGLNALYIGGGFPETHGAALAANHEFLAALRTAAQSGLPIYAECGGLMLLSRAILWKGTRYPMSGVFSFEVEVFPSPQGHGYVELLVDQPNPFFPQGVSIRGHEFHYSKIVAAETPYRSVCAVRRGTGCGQGRDGLIQGNVWASYTHIHALGTPEWAQGLLAAAGNRAQSSP
jgi:cobyrinic acid a,c-diamide synthase